MSEVEDTNKAKAWTSLPTEIPSKIVELGANNLNSWEQRWCTRDLRRPTGEPGHDKVLESTSKSLIHVHSILRMDQSVAASCIGE